MIHRVLNSKNFVAILLAMATGTLLYFKLPWPMTAAIVPQTWNEYFLRLVALRDPWTYAGLKASYHIMLFTTPYIGYSFLLSALYIFTLRPRRRAKPQPLPLYPSVESRDQLSLVIGEIHNPRVPIPAENPSWLIIPERGLFTGTIMIGAIGSGKTAGGMYPFTDQLLGYRAANPQAKASALVLEVKGDFCGKVQEILRNRDRADDARSAVDQSLSRFVRRGEISRISRGVFVRPKKSRYVGEVMPEPSEVARAIASTHGETIQVHGAEAARLLGLTTQMPLQVVFCSSGPNRELRLGNLKLIFKHVAQRKLALAGRQSGLALSALWYLGKEQVDANTIQTIRKKLTSKAFAELKAEKRAMPGWMVDVLHPCGSKTTSRKILKRIQAMHRGAVFTPRQFANLGTRAAINQALSRLQRKGQIRRLTWGVYEFPKIHPKLGVLSPYPAAVAKAIAEKTGSRITISGAKAANLLGLSNQVPLQNVFWTEGPSRTVRIGNQTVTLKHVARSKMIGAGTEAGIVIQAICLLGEQGVHEIPVHCLAKQLPRSVKRAVKRLTPTAPAWSQPVLNQITA